MSAIFGSTWADSLFFTTCILIVFVLLFKLLQLSAKRTYYAWLNNPSTPLDVDSFVDTATNPPKYLKIAFLQKMSVGDRKPSDDVVKLASVESTHVPGLQVTERAEVRAGSMKEPSLLAKEVVVDPEKPEPLVIGEIYTLRYAHVPISYVW